MITSGWLLNCFMGVSKEYSCICFMWLVLTNVVIEVFWETIYVRNLDYLKELDVDFDY